MKARAPVNDPATKYHPVMLALGKAKAAAGLLEEIQRSTQVPTMALATLDRDGWLTTIAMDALHAALDAADAAFVKSQAGTPEPLRVVREGASNG